MNFRWGLVLAAMGLASCSTVPVLDLAPRRALAPAPKVAAVRSADPAPPAKRSRLVEGASIRAPTGYLIFCRENAGDCPSGPSETVALSREMEATVDQTNVAVNRRISPANEAFEQWSASVDKGDCEDYALTKRRVLMQAGLPPSSLRIAVATTSSGEMHAVLVVKTTGGDLVLDNRNDSVLDPQQTDLRWIKMASADDPRRWNTIRADTGTS